MSVKKIPVNEIKSFLDRQSRKDEFEKLKDSIAKYDVLVPIQVTKLKKPKKAKGGIIYKYQLVWGHRRLRAAKEVGLEKIPAEIVPINDKERVKRFFMENEARKQLTAYEVALLMEADRGKLSIAEMAEKYSMTEATVRGSLRAIENASPALRKHLDNGTFTLEDAKTITTLPTHREQTLIVNRALDKGLRGRMLKKEIRSIRTINRINVRTINAKQRALHHEIRTMTDDKTKVEERYMNGVVALMDALNDDKFRALLRKSKIDYSPFWSE